MIASKLFRLFIRTFMTPRKNNLLLFRSKVHKCHYTVKLGNKERFDKEQIGIKEPFPVTNLPFTS